MAGGRGMDQDYDKDQNELTLSSSTASASHVGLSSHIKTYLPKGSKRCHSLSKTLLSTLTFPRVIYISNFISNVD